MVKLVVPSYEFKESYEKYIGEVIKNGEQHDLGNAFRENETYDQFLDRVHKRRYGINISKKDVASTIYFIISNNEIVGTIDLRSYLNADYYNNFGHVAYIIKPSCRNNGYATKALREAIKIYRQNGVCKILVMCYKKNIASSSVIQKNNGILEKEYKDPHNNIIQRWWINILEEVKK